MKSDSLEPNCFKLPISVTWSLSLWSPTVLKLPNYVTWNIPIWALPCETAKHCDMKSGPLEPYWSKLQHIVTWSLAHRSPTVLNYQTMWHEIYPFEPYCVKQPNIVTWSLAHWSSILFAITSMICHGKLASFKTLWCKVFPSEILIITKRIIIVCIHATLLRWSASLSLVPLDSAHLLLIVLAPFTIKLSLYKAV